MESPELKFGYWSAWEERGLIEDSRYPGVYVLAMSDEDLAGKPVNYQDVHYN